MNWVRPRVAAQDNQIFALAKDLMAFDFPHPLGKSVAQMVYFRSGGDEVGVLRVLAEEPCDLLRCIEPRDWLAVIKDQTRPEELEVSDGRRMVARVLVNC